MSTSWQGVDPQLHEAFDNLSIAVSQAGGSLTLTSTIRTTREQEYLYKRFLEGKSGGLPAAPPYHSAHEYGWAFDAVTAPWEWQADVGALFRQMGGVWGANKDPVHFELPGAGRAAFANGEAVVAAQPSLPETPEIHAQGLLQYLSRLVPKVQDTLLSLVPGVGAIQLTASLLRIGYTDSEVLKILSEPMETLAADYPEIYDALSPLPQIR